MTKPLYFDCHATTPVAAAVVQAMAPYWSECFGNPAGASVWGWEAEAAVEQARAAVAAAIGARPSEIIFTSGATEANNLAIKGVAEAGLARGRHLVTVTTEHSAVLAPCAYLERLGFTVDYLPVDGEGQIDLTQLAAVLRPDTVLVSIMAANNEIGVLHPLAEIGALCRERGIWFHTDAAQAIGKISLSVETLPIDLLSLTAHKCYGPKGIGALYVRTGTPLASQLHGGGQEHDRRSGTLNVPLIVGMAQALTLAIADLPHESPRLATLRDRLWAQLTAALPDLVLNGSGTNRLPHNLNFSVPGLNGNALVAALRPYLAVSSGSACAAGRPSHVLQALGRSPALANASLRFGLGKFHQADDIDRAAAVVIDAVQKLR
ncbi:MAG TPA: IscS subfamily cysteine desulfurase [Cyanobacteria bacterium UBA8156]|jgi:cysteine desulfurase|nr:IscS subfamily cysteine desulfurase [Cyanobacteria bacterium UBA8156]